MSTLQLLLALIKLVELVFDYMQRKQLLKEAEDAQVARRMSDLLAKTQTAQRVDAHLRDLGNDGIDRLLSGDFRTDPDTGQLLLDLPTDQAKSR